MSTNVTGMAAAPFLKWPGGKRQLLAQYAPYLPQVIEGRYFEPFVGGGALFFHLRPFQAVLGDANEELINVYRVVRDQPLQLIANLLSQGKTKEHFHEIRGWDRRNSQGRRVLDELSPIDRAGRFIALNRLSFNGLVRYNRKGEFNAPYGYYADPVIANPWNIMAASLALRNVELLAGDFRQLIGRFSPGEPDEFTAKDFIFFDPPYAPLVEQGSNFNAYTGDGFGEKEHIELAEFFIDLGAKGIPAMLSNADTPFVRALFSSEKIIEIQARRRINQDGNGRGKISELLILNQAHARFSKIKWSVCPEKSLKFLGTTK